MISIIIHGGAWSIPESMIPPIKRSLLAIVKEGFTLLKTRKLALDVVEFVVRQLEDDPLFDAGKGSYPNTLGIVEMDAIIVNGYDLNFGAVAGIRNVNNPINIARAVMEKTDHSMLVGEGATNFAHSIGFEFVENESLLSTNFTNPVVHSETYSLQASFAARMDSASSGSAPAPPG